MSPRAMLPGADELFRATSPHPTAAPKAPDEIGPPPAAGGGGSEHDPSRTQAHRRRGGADRGSTGRERHEEKITVYVSASELVDLERARLTLRAEHGIAVDRGRIVREALSVLLADLDGKHGDSILVRRLAAS